MSSIYLISLITILLTFWITTLTSSTTLPPITTPRDLDRSLLDSSPPEGMELQEVTSLVNTIVRSSTLETPVKQYIERSEAAFERTTSKNTLLQKEIAEYRELSWVRKEHKNGKRVAIKGKFVFNTKEILEVVKKAEVEASKRKVKKRRTTKAINPEIEEEQEEDNEENTSESESDCIVIVSRRSNWTQKGRIFDPLPHLIRFPIIHVRELPGLPLGTHLQAASALHWGIQKRLTYDVPCVSNADIWHADI